MKVGEKAILKCRADYAYGDSPPVSLPYFMQPKALVYVGSGGLEKWF